MKRSPLRRSTGLRRIALRRRPPRRKPNGYTRAEALRRDQGCVLALYEPSHGECWGALEVHHRKRRSQGGTDELDNLVTLCTAGHMWVHAHPAVSFALGLLLHSWEPVERLVP